MIVKIGNHVAFAVEGSTITEDPEVNTSRENTPSSGVPGGFVGVESLSGPWVTIPCLETASVESKEQGAEEVYCPTGGTYGLEEEVGGRVTTTLDFTAQNITPLLAQLIYGTATVPDAATANIVPGKRASIKGWIILDQYDHKENLMARIKAYGKLMLNGTVEMGDKVVKPKLRFKIMEADNNAVNFSESGLTLD